MITYDFKLEAGDRNAGTVYLPSGGAENIPVIICCNGWGGNRQLRATTQVLCDKAMSESLALVTFDFFGCGETGGDLRHMTHARWKNNLSEIVSWVQSQPFSSSDKIGCYAFSSGSTAALRLAAEERRLAFIISVGTCISTHYGMRNGGPAKRLADNLDKLVAGGRVSVFGVKFGLDFFIDAICNAPIHTMHKISCPVLFLQGMQDDLFRCADAKMAYDLMTRENSQNGTAYIPLEGADHGLSNMAEEAMCSAFEWLLPVLERCGQLI